VTGGTVKKNEKILLGGWLLLMLWILMVILSFTACDGGWSVGGLEL